MKRVEKCGDEDCMECENERLRAENLDLKARLRAAKKRDGRSCYSCASPQTKQPALYDLRVKNWRKP